MSATGYLIVGGNSTGFSFDEPAFYLKISDFAGDLESARILMAHELYHAVQNIAQARRPKPATYQFENERYAALPAGITRECYAIRAFFDYLLAEGTASYVGDDAMLPAHGVYADRERPRSREGLQHLEQHATLLDMSLAAITGPTPTPADDVYAVGFYSPAPLYALGYTMAKAIAEHDGDTAFGQFIGGPGDAFARRYMVLTDTPGSKLPKLGPRAPVGGSRRVSRVNHPSRLGRSHVSACAKLTPRRAA